MKREQQLEKAKEIHASLKGENIEDKDIRSIGSRLWEIARGKVVREASISTSSTTGEGKTPPSSAIHEYFLHFVGKGLYSVDDFAKESEKHGVNRALPIGVLKQMKWGDKVLLAQFETPNSARVFGYFVVTGLNFDCQDKKEFTDKLVSELDVVEETEGCGLVERMCGSYDITASYSVENELDEVVDKVREVVSELGTSVKVFAGGHFRKLEPFTMEPVLFTRTGFYIKLDTKLESGSVKKKHIAFMGDYKKREYFKKGEKHKRSLEEFI